MPTEANGAQANAVLEEALRGGQSFSRVLKRGQILKLADVEGGANVAALFFNAEQHLERYNMPDTLKAQHISRLTAGNSLFSDMGHVLVSIVSDTAGWHDTITGHMTAEASLAKFGPGSYQKLRNDFFRNTRDNFLVELGKYGLGRRDLHANVNFFTKVVADLDGKLTHSRASRPGSSVELRADMNVLVVLSNTPHPLDPSTTYAPKPVALSIRTGRVAAPNDACRTACPESERAFTLTDRYFS
jgi:urea carboxylase-associated protein 2